jgi:cytidylate kinase
MNKPQGIIVSGAKVSGKTTLGRELSRILNIKRMDAEDYYFREAEIPYSDARSKIEVISLMLADIEKHRTFVISTCIGDLGDVIPQYYKLAVYIKAPYELRMERVKQRNNRGLLFLFVYGRIRINHSGRGKCCVQPCIRI